MLYAIWDDVRVKGEMAASRIYVSEFILFLLYLLAGLAFGGARMPRFIAHGKSLALLAAFLGAVGAALHCKLLYAAVLSSGGIDLSLANTASMIGLELAVIALIASLEATLRGISAGLLVLAAAAALATTMGVAPEVSAALAWQVKAHVLVSLLSYGLLTVGAIVAVYATLHERRLRSGHLSTINNIFAPLDTTENLLFGIAAAGFAGLLLAILSGLTFVDNLFAQHLVHKTVFSILALLVFGTLLAGRYVAGWRGARAVRLYLGGFALLCVAYFGTRLILEQLNRSWG